jgi:hypothetical protein
MRQSNFPIRPCDMRMQHADYFQINNNSKAFPLSHPPDYAKIPDAVLSVALPAPSPECTPIFPGTGLSKFDSESDGMYRASSPPPPGAPRTLPASPRTPYSDGFTTAL